MDLLQRGRLIRAQCTRHLGWRGLWECRKEAIAGGFVAELAGGTAQPRTVERAIFPLSFFPGEVKPLQKLYWYPVMGGTAP